MYLQIFFIMGKNKWFDEFEGLISKNSKTSNARHYNGQPSVSNLPGHYTGKIKEEKRFFDGSFAPFKAIKRKWHAIKFFGIQFRNIAFDKKFLLKVSVLFAAGFYLFKGNVDSGLSVGNSQFYTPEYSETQFSVTPEDKSTKQTSKKKVPKPKPKEKVAKKSKPTSETAPVSRENIKSDRSIQYIRKYASIARQDMYKYGVPASISLAQGLVESRAGTSKLAVENNNHFGMKCFSRNCKKGHCSNYTDDSHKDFFLKFKAPIESWKAHSILISSGKYAKLKKHGKDYRGWAKGLKSIGYATDKTYDKKLIGIIERYDLDQYDR